MNSVGIIRSDSQLADYPRNLAAMLNGNAAKFGERPVLRQLEGGEYDSLSWSQFCREIRTIQNSLIKRGLEPGDRVAIVSRNRKEMLELELAVMSLGAAAVPIFPAYTPEQTGAMVRFCEPKMVVAAEQLHFGKIGNPNEFQTVIHMDPIKQSAANIIPFRDMLSTQTNGEILGGEVDADTVCLMMYTSGTMGKPKCVQLTHRCILSQQAAGKSLWPVIEEDRFLTYLPWHHSYGGIFEKYTALANGACMALESGYGKDLELLFENWRKIRPTVFFSVPMIYQAMVTRARQDKRIAELLFHEDLRFVFTAAAPLPKSVSDDFDRCGITVLEGWGLTETSPCCTVTRPGMQRNPGVVGWPIPGVELMFAQDGEILVKGPNVMKGYFQNPEATDLVFTADGWFKTGDVGEMTEEGVRLISRKDRIFKLSNAEKVIPSEIENMITRECPYLAWAFVTGSGKSRPVAILFPNRAMFTRVPEDARLPVACSCPRDAEELAHCLGHCLMQVNRGLDEEYCRMSSVMLVDHELSIETEELTPSMKLAPNVVGRAFKAHIEYLHGAETGESSGFDEAVYIIRLDE